MLNMAYPKLKKMPNKSLLKRVFSIEAESIAIYYREELGISKFDPLDAFELATYLEVPIFSIEEAFDKENSNSFYQTLSNTEKFDAIWMKNQDGDKIIIHNTNHSESRQQSNIMHELAHIY